MRTRFYQIGKDRAAGLAFTVTVALYLLVALCFSAIAQGVPKEQREQDYVFFYLSFFLPIPVIILSFITLFELTAYNGHDFLTFKFKAIDIIPVILIFMGTFLSLNKVNDLVVKFLNGLGYSEPQTTLPPFSVYDYAECVVVICVLPAIMEEALFRGVIVNGLKGGGIMGILISALAFSVYHMSPAKTVYQFLMGIVFAVVYLKTGSVIATAIIHFLNNFAIVTLNYFPLGFLTEGTVAAVLPFIGAATAALGFVLLFTFEKKNKIPAKNGDNGVIGGFMKYSAIGMLACATVWIAGLLA